LLKNRGGFCCQLLSALALGAKAEKEKGKAGEEVEILECEHSPAFHFYPPIILPAIFIIRMNSTENTTNPRGLNFRPPMLVVELTPSMPAWLWGCWMVVDAILHLICSNNF
jgi:hypothetical protein